MAEQGDVEKIAFGYYVLGFMRSVELSGKLPPDNALEWLREEFAREWKDVGARGRRVLSGDE